MTWVNQPECSEPAFTCGESYTDDTGSTAKDWLNHDKERTVTLTMPDGGSIILQQRTRTFRYDSEGTYQQLGVKLIQGVAFACIDGETEIYTANLKEYYRCLDTEILYMDLRNDLVVYRELIEVMDITASSDESVQLTSTWGPVQRHKFEIPSPVIDGTDKIKMYRKGTVTELSSRRTHRAYFDDIRLAALDQSADMNHATFDFYRISDHYEADGGRDMYWPDWLKVLGQINQALDETDASLRLGFVQYGDDPLNIETGAPTVANDPSPIGSFAFDYPGNFFMSVLADRTAVNRLEDADGTLQNVSELTGIEGDVLVCYPIAPS